MDAPQIIYLVFTAIGLLVNAATDGKEVTVQYNFAIGFMKKAITIALLFWGGFFGGG